MHDQTSVFEAIGWRFNHLPEARRSRRRGAEALAKQVAQGHAELRADELLPGDLIRLEGNVWLVQDARLGSAGICFLATLGGHMQACERSHRVQLLSAEGMGFQGAGRATRPRRRVPATRRRVAA